MSWMNTHLDFSLNYYVLLYYTISIDICEQKKKERRNNGIRNGMQEIIFFFALHMKLFLIFKNMFTVVCYFDEAIFTSYIHRGVW